MSLEDTPTLSSIWAKFCEIGNDTSATRNELSNFKIITNDRIGALEGSVDDYKQKCSEMELRLSALEEGGTSSIPNQIDIETSKQAKLGGNLCIHGVPERQNESIMNIIKAICAALNVKFNNTDIISAHRSKPSAKSPGLIVVKFVNFNKKIELLQAKKNKKSLNLAQLKMGLEPKNKLIYFNHHMTPFYANIHRKCKQAQSDGSIEGCWLSSNGIIIKLNDNSTRLINKMDDIETIINEHLTSYTEIGDENSDTASSSRHSNNNRELQLDSPTTVLAENQKRKRGPKKGSKRKASSERSNKSKSARKAIPLEVDEHSDTY